MRRHKSDPFTGAALAALRAAKPPPSNQRRPPWKIVAEPTEGDYHKRASEHGYINGRRIA